MLKGGLAVNQAARHDSLHTVGACVPIRTYIIDINQFYFWHDSCDSVTGL